MNEIDCNSYYKYTILLFIKQYYFVSRIHLTGFPLAEISLRSASKITYLSSEF